MDDSRESGFMRMGPTGKKMLGLMDSEILCPMCFQVWTDPRLLQCGHALCSSCIGRLITKALGDRDAARNAPMTAYQSAQELLEAHFPCCPICHSPLSTYEFDGARWPTVPYYTELAETVTPQAEGSNRGENDAIDEWESYACRYTDDCKDVVSFICMDGCGSMCEKCKDIHGKVRNTKSHRVESSEFTGNVTLDSSKYCCWRHPGFQLKYLCVDCKSQPIYCVHCAYEDKMRLPDHTHVPFDINMQEVFEGVQSLLSKAKEKAKSSRGYEKGISQGFLELDQACINIKQQVHDVIQNYINLLKDIEVAISKQVDEESDQLTLNYRLELERFEYIRSKVKYAEKLIHSLTSKTSDERVPSKLFYAKSILEGVINEKIQTGPVKLDSLAFSPIPHLSLWLEDTAQEQLSMLGYSVLIHHDYDIDSQRYALSTVKLVDAHHLLPSIDLNKWSGLIPDNVSAIAIDQKKTYLHIVTIKGEIHRYNVSLSSFDKRLKLDYSDAIQCFSSFHLVISASGMLVVYNEDIKIFKIITSEYVEADSFSLSSFTGNQNAVVSSICFDKVGQIFVLTTKPMLIYILSPSGKFKSRLLDRELKEKSRVPATVVAAAAASGLASQAISNPNVIMVSASSKLFLLSNNVLEIRSIHGELIRSIPLGSKRFWDFASSDDGLTVLVGREPIFLDSEGNVLPSTFPTNFMKKFASLSPGQSYTCLTPEDIFAVCHDKSVVSGVTYKFDF